MWSIGAYKGQVVEAYGFRMQLMGAIGTTRQSIGAIIGSIGATGGL